jgi:DNA (cytosine-5)-methyltransferase 1
MRPRLLDLFCGAGGAAMGYHRAGFEVFGVDHRPQPHYPFAHVVADALEYAAAHGRDHDVIHASPPCQAYVQRNKRLDTKHPRLIGPTRRALEATGRPYVIENVEGAPLYFPVILCGSLFGLPLRRHRLFECPAVLLLAPSCQHRGTVANGDVAAVYECGGYGLRHGRDTDGRRVRDREPAKAAPAWEVAMGIDWMEPRELTQAIPPAYTAFIGAQLLRALGANPLAAAPSS